MPVIFTRIAIACLIIPFIFSLGGPLLCAVFPSLEEILIHQLSFVSHLIVSAMMISWLIAPFFFLLSIVARDVKKVQQSHASIPLDRAVGYLLSGLAMIIATITITIFFLQPKEYTGAWLMPPFFMTGFFGFAGYAVGWALGIFYLFFARRKSVSVRVKPGQILLALLIFVPVIATVHHQYRYMKAKSVRTPPDELQKIFSQKWSKNEGREAPIFFALAENKTCPPDILIKMSEISGLNKHLARRILDNPNVGVEVLSNLSRQGDVKIRRLVAQHRLASNDILDNLKNDSDVTVRYYVMKNSNTPQEMLSVLFNDIEVRRTFAWDRQTPPHVLDSLKNDSDFEVRYYVAANPNVPQETLRFFLNDKDERIRKWSERRLKKMGIASKSD